MASETTDSLYGLTPALPADQSKTPPSTTSPNPLSPAQYPPPSTPLANRISSYTRAKLPPKVYAHSHRVYYYGRFIAQECYPSWNMTPNSKLDETWYITALLHDIGTTPEHISSTKLSYEFWAGYHALGILQDVSATAPHGPEGVATREQAESIAEAIIRHQDVQDKGFISLLTRLIHMGTLLDNVGAGSELVHPETIRAVNEAYDRSDWSGCFRDTVVKEKQLKPWAMVSRIEGFEEQIEDNGKGLMKTWD